MNCEIQFVECNTCVIRLVQSYCMQLDSKSASRPLLPLRAIGREALSDELSMQKEAENWAA